MEQQYKVVLYDRYFKEVLDTKYTKAESAAEARKKVAAALGIEVWNLVATKAKRGDEE